MGGNQSLPCPIGMFVTFLNGQQQFTTINRSMDNNSSSNWTNFDTTKYVKDSLTKKYKSI